MIIEIRKLNHLGQYDPWHAVHIAHYITKDAGIYPCCLIEQSSSSFWLSCVYFWPPLIICIDNVPYRIHWSQKQIELVTLKGNMLKHFKPVKKQERNWKKWKETEINFKSL